MAGAVTPVRFHVLAKPTGAICNLDCTYCFYLDHESLYPGGRFRMDDDVLSHYLAQLFDAHRHVPEVTIAWQGGEPTLMGRGFFARAVARCEALKAPGQRVEHTIQTNATLLDDEWGAFFAEHGFLVGVSIDGPRAMHDAFRVDKRGAPTFDRVMRGTQILQRHGVDVNVLCSVHAANEQHPREVYRFLRDDVGATFVQPIPIVERDGDAATAASVSPAGWGEFLVQVFDEWVARDVGRVFVSTFDSALAKWLGVPGGLCIFDETCGTALALEHNGDVYACDHFVDTDHLLGNVLHDRLVDLVRSPAQRAFGAAKRDTLPAVCRRCPVRFACNGECPKNRFVPGADGTEHLQYLCAGYLRFFTHIDTPMRQMAALIRQGRHADEVMRLPR